MKRFYFAAVVAFAMLLMSCIDDKSTISNGKAWVTFDVAAEQIGTRVYGDGVAANDLEYAIYEKDKYDAPLIKDEIVGAFAGDVMQTSFSEKLAVGKSYVVLFWADAEQDPYTVDWNNQTIKITDPDALTAQNENLDAFFAKHEVKVTGPQTEPVELRRPFAQLNIGTADTADAQAAGLMVKKSEVTVQAYTTLNLMNGSVDDAMELTYEMANIPSGENKTFTVKGKSYDNLSMNYLLVNTKELVTVKFTTNDGTENVNTATYAQIPVERNYKTFIVGNLLTSAVNIDIIILPDWGKNDHIYDGNIIVEKSEVTSYKSGADETVGFTSKEAWTAQVVAGAMRADESDDSWCTVEPTSGEAGDAEITITTQPNDTGEDRTATVVITAGESTQEITVTQLATTKPAEEGDSPVPSNQIWYTTTDGNAVTPYNVNAFGAAITSNTYEDGKGVITFDGDITEIGYAAFGLCSTMESISLPSSITKIGQQAFQECTELKSITIPDGVTEIGLQAFAYCDNIQSITLPKSVTRIGDYAFAVCNNLQSITLHDSITEFGTVVCYDCFNLKSVNIHISDLAAYCHSNLLGSFVNVEFSPIKHLYINNEEIINLTIPEGVTSIGLYAFNECGSLQSITIPDSVTEIGLGAFFGCANLQSINIPDGVTEIKTFTFNRCISLKQINIPDGVTHIGNHVFYGCANLESIDIPDSVTHIGWGTFEDCTNLKNVYCKPVTPPTFAISDMYPTFGNNAEDRKIYVPAKSLEAYRTAEGWIEYADYIFADPSTEGDNEETTAPASNQIWYTSTNESVVEPNFAFGIGILSNTYEDGKGVITFDGEVTLIGYMAFSDCSSLTSITIPESVTNIGYRAFYNCTSLESIIIPEGVTTIEVRAFEGCTSLQSITIPESVTTIGSFAFERCTRLKSIAIPERVTTISDQVFLNCSSLESITIPESVTTIEFGAFEGCTSLENITIPNSVTTIIAAFQGCTSLKSIIIPESVTTIELALFNGCTSLTSVTIPNSVTKIGESAFKGCSSLESITIPEGVTEIGALAFYGCISLTSVYCKPVTPPTLMNFSAFEYNAYSRKIYVPASSVEAYKTANGWSDYADYIFADPSTVEYAE